MIELGVNIDHVATLRQARGETQPDVLEAARIVEATGADSITIHLREDRRHIQDHDVYLLRKEVKTRLNLEMALSEEIIAIALDVVPEQVTVVPEKRRELTTEGGLNVLKEQKKIERAITRFKKKGIKVSLFINPVLGIVRKSASLGADAIELHTGQYADAFKKGSFVNQLKKVHAAAKEAHNFGLQINAGHGLDYDNVSFICNIQHLVELNIGHSIISKAVFIGLGNAVIEMKRIIARRGVVCRPQRLKGK